MIDRDHLIGHSYFLKIYSADNQLEELYQVWYRELIPLLQEYFYNRWDKLAILLGEFKGEQGPGFVKMKRREDIAREFSGSEVEDYTDVSIGDIHSYTKEQLPEILSKL